MEPTKTVIVTGGGKGIGAAISRCFHEKGFHVVIGSRNDNGLAAALGERARFHPTDVTRPEELQSLVRACVEWTGRLDVMINNAGFSEWRSIVDADEAFWDRMIDTNLKGVFFGCRAAQGYLKRGGCIINISSLAGKRGSANNAVYCGSKFGVNGVTQALAKELGPRGIRVNAVCPVYVKTEGLILALEQEPAPPRREPVDRYLEAFAAANSALNRLPSGEDIAAACLFLSSPAASAITGQCINVDCGVLPQ